MSVAEELCHRISIINHGKILATGNMGELKKRGSTDDSLEGIFLKITEEELQKLHSVKTTRKNKSEGCFLDRDGT